MTYLPNVGIIFLRIPISHIAKFNSLDRIVHQTNIRKISVNDLISFQHNTLLSENPNVKVVYT